MAEITLSARFEDALVYAARLHRQQRRKGNNVPYVSHLMAVAALTLEHGGDEDQAIAALLHDAAEDQGGRDELQRIEVRFGAGVSKIVADCSDSLDVPKPSWRPRKEAYVAGLASKPARSLLVSLADKTHNAECIRDDFGQLGEAVWDRFTGSGAGVRWYYTALSAAFCRYRPSPLAERLASAVSGFATKAPIRS